MNIGCIIARILMCTGLTGLLLVLLIKVLDKFTCQYIVHYKYVVSGVTSYEVVNAFSERGAAKKVPEYFYGEYRTITKVIRCKNI